MHFQFVIIICQNPIFLRHEIKLTPVKQCFPSRKSRTGDKLSTLVCSKGFVCVDGWDDDDDDDDIEEDVNESSSNSPAKAAASALLNSGNISFVTRSVFNVPSWKFNSKIIYKIFTKQNKTNRYIKLCISWIYCVQNGFLWIYMLWLN